MRRIALAAAAIATFAGAGLAVGTSGTAAAEDGAATAPTVLPFSQILRRCDFSKFQYVGGDEYGRATGLLRVSGGEVIVDLQLATGTPNSRYDVKLIQVPRSSAASCNAGDPGVSVTSLNTDAGGAGATSVRGPITGDATGVWVSISRPSPFSQAPQEFYTTDTIVDI